jgi:CDGSH-type Zn-finger protein
LSDSTATPDSANIGFTVPNGPFIVTGDLQISLADGQSVSQPRASLCRCGASSRKPFCDGSHRTIGFADAGDALPADPLGEPGAPAPVAFSCVPGGPLLASGPLTIQNAQKQTIANSTETWLCRCGASANKPYCDGSHAGIGFEG